MTTSTNHRLPTLLACLGLACASGEGERLADPVIDTTAGGHQRVMSPSATAWRDTTGWRVVEDLRVTGAEGTEAELINPQSLGVDAQGRIFVMDEKPQVIKVFGRDGRLVRTMGREGEGPGEFRAGFLAVRGEYVVVHDPRVSRTSVFDTAGAFIRSWPSSCCYWTQIGFDADGHIHVPALEPSGAPGAPWVRYRVDGTLVDTLWIPRQPDSRSWTVRSGRGANRMMASTTIPFTPSIHSAFHPAGGIVYGSSGDYLLIRSATGLDTVRLYGRRWTPDPVTDRHKQEIVDSIVNAWDHMDPALLRAAFNPADIPSQRTAFQSLSVDESGNTWVRVGPAPEGGLRYDVFDPEGAWLGEVRFPEVFQLWNGQHFGRDAVTVSMLDDDGRPVIVRYRIER